MDQTIARNNISWFLNQLQLITAPVSEAPAQSATLAAAVTPVDAMSTASPALATRAAAISAPLAASVAKPTSAIIPPDPPVIRLPQLPAPLLSPVHPRSSLSKLATPSLVLSTASRFSTRSHDTRARLMLDRAFSRGLLAPDSAGLTG